MTSRIRPLLRALSLATALAVAVPVLAAPAAADDALTTAVLLGEDTLALGGDTLADVARGCTPYVRSWTPKPLKPEPFIRNNSTWYKITGGGTAHMSCSASMKVMTRLIDVSVPPLFPTVIGRYSTAFVTSANPGGTGLVEVPYVGPDAGGIRPFGQITVRVEVYRRLSTGRYAQVHYGCMEWSYVMQPAMSLTVSDPSPQGGCKYGAALLAVDTADGVTYEAALPADSAEALAG